MPRFHVAVVYPSKYSSKNHSLIYEAEDANAAFRLWYEKHPLIKHPMFVKPDKLLITLLGETEIHFVRYAESEDQTNQSGRATFDKLS